MAVTPIPVTQLPIDDSGLRLDNVTVAGDNVNGNSWAVDRFTGLYVDNTAGAPATLTLQATVKGAAMTKAISLAASEKRFVPPVDMYVWGGHAGVDDGKVYALPSAATVKLLPFRWYQPANG